MRKSVARIKGIGFMLWHGKHELIHVLLGLLWAWVLRELWGEFNLRWIFWSVFASLLPDLDHFIYWVVYGRKDPYSRQVLRLLKERQWRNVFVFVEQGHKNQTNLFTHNYFVTTALVIICFTAWVFDWEVGVILFGAMCIHYVFDIVDDLLMLGHVNPNWKRLGRPKQIIHSTQPTYE